MDRLHLGGSCAATKLELDFEALGNLPEQHQVADVGTLAQGRQGKAVRLAALRELARISPQTRFVHVACADGSFTANLELEEASQGLVLYELDGSPLPERFGGPFRLLFPDSEDCSVNVKFLSHVDFLEEPGSHTARCSD